MPARIEHLFGPAASIDPLPHTNMVAPPSWPPRPDAPVEIREWRNRLDGYRVCFHNAAIEVSDHLIASGPTGERFRDLCLRLAYWRSFIEIADEQIQAAEAADRPGDAETTGGTT